MNMKPTLPQLSLLYCSLLLLCAGCTTPDLKPFAGTTATLKQAVVQSQKIIRAEVGGVADAPNLTNPAQVMADNGKISGLFDKRRAFMEAMVAYSDSLASVADAGENSRANAQSLGDSVKQLASAAGAYGDAVGAGTDIMVKIYALAAEAWAVHTLREATAKVDPAVQSVAVVIQMDMTNVIAILQTVKEEANASIKFPHREENVQRNRALSKRNELLSELADALGATNMIEQVAVYNRRVAELDKTLQSMDEWYLPMQKQIAENNQRIADEVDIANNTIQGFEEWAKVHAGLKKSLQENRQPNVRELASTVLEINDEIEKLKKR
jgi:hypothetical protein